MIEIEELIVTILVKKSATRILLTKVNNWYLRTWICLVVYKRKSIKWEYVGGVDWFSWIKKNEFALEEEKENLFVYW